MVVYKYSIADPDLMVLDYIKHFSVALIADSVWSPSSPFVLNSLFLKFQVSRFRREHRSFLPGIDTS